MTREITIGTLDLGKVRVKAQIQNDDSVDIIIIHPSGSNYVVAKIDKKNQAELAHFLVNVPVAESSDVPDFQDVEQTQGSFNRTC